MITAAPTIAIQNRFCACPVASGCWPRRLTQASVLACLFTIALLPEFPRDNTFASASLIYAKAIGRFRFADLAIVALVIFHLFLLGCLRKKVLRFPTPLALPSLGFLFCVALAIARGGMAGGTNLFFDWRNLALGATLYFVWAFWIRDNEDIKHAVRAFAICVAARIFILGLQFFLGTGDTLDGVRIPTFDGPTISAMVLTALLALCSHEAAGSKFERLTWLTLGMVSTLMVLLCFRRTYWATLLVGATIVILVQRKARFRALTKIAVAVAVASFILGPMFYARLASFNLAQKNSQFSEDNSDHVDDLLDAWDQVGQSPILGVGIGVPYPTWRIRNWKSESVMVHNAPLHVWIKFGICGLVFYLWFHISLLLWIGSRVRNVETHATPFATAALAYLAAQFLVSLSFAPWPYSELQNTILISFLVTATPMTNLPYARSVFLA
jgi:O-antigen ligase